MNNVFTREDSKRIKKLEEALNSLKQGEKSYFPITKLVSIKSLCKNESVLREYCVYLTAQVLKTPGKLPVKFTKKDIKLIVEGVAKKPENNTRANELLSATIECQNSKKKIGSNIVRVIQNKEVLVLEGILNALLSRGHVAPKYAYDATKNYVEAYNGAYGTGLIIDSIPMFEKVLIYWRSHERDNSQFSKKPNIKVSSEEDVAESSWSGKGETLSHNNACKEFGLEKKDIIEAIRGGKLQFRQGVAHGNPYFKLLRVEVEIFANEINGFNGLENQKITHKLNMINKEINSLKRKLSSLEREKLKLMESQENYN